MFSFECYRKADYERTTGRIEGEILVERAAVLPVEDIIHAYARSESETLEAVYGMARGEVPDAVAGSVAVSVTRIIGLALHTAVQIHI